MGLTGVKPSMDTKFVARNSAVGIGARMSKGATIKDVGGEIKDKFINRTKTNLAAAAVGVGTGAATGLLVLKEGFAAKLLSKMPAGIKGKITNIANSNFVKSFAETSASLLSKTSNYAKAHPAIFAAVSLVGTVGLGVSVLLQRHQDKTDGKIEQKYDDKIQLRNEAAKALD